MNMPSLPFQIANILSALVWSPSLLLIGALAGTVLRDYPMPAWAFAALLVLALALIWLTHRLGLAARCRDKAMSRWFR